LAKGDSIVRRTALVKNGLVENVILLPAESDDLEQLKAGVAEQFACEVIDCHDWEDPNHPYSYVSPGFTWDGTKFIAPEVPADTVTEESLAEAARVMEQDDALRSQEYKFDPNDPRNPKPASPTVTGGNE
jgi:hypothetical protein